MLHPSHVLETPETPARSTDFELDAPARSRNGHHARARSFGKGSILFFAGEPANGGYLLRRGRVKLSLDSPAGRSVIVHIAGPGEIVGLSAAIGAKQFALTAETLDDCDAEYFKCADLERFLAEDPDAACLAIRQLSRAYS